jgi:hypothetical protein
MGVYKTELFPCLDKKNTSILQNHCSFVKNKVYETVVFSKFKRLKVFNAMILENKVFLEYFEIILLPNTP